MATKHDSRRGAPADRFRFVRTLEKTTTLIACTVLTVGGISSGVGTRAVVFRCLFTSVVIMLVFATVINIMTRYEEVQSGKA